MANQIIGLIDVDGHNFPNLALMKLSAHHKKHEDYVEWWNPEREHYDIVYMARVFNDEYSKDIPKPHNADIVIRGGQDMPLNWLMEKKCLIHLSMLCCLILLNISCLIIHFILNIQGMVRV